MTKKFFFKAKAVVYLFAFIIMMVQTSKAQCPILNQTPIVTPSSICVTGTATVTIPSSEVGVTYALTTGTTVVGGFVSGTGSSISFPTGTLTVTTTFIVGATNGTCTVTMTPPVTVTVNPLPTVVITPTKTVMCSGQIDTLTASGAVNYSWTPGGSTAVTHTVNPNTNTNYTLTGTDANGCTNKSTFSLTVNPTPTVAIGTSSFGGICPGATATLTASGATTYTWSANAGSATTATVAVSPSVTTVYTVTGTNASGCSSTKTRTVTVNPTATITISGNAFLCQGQSTTLTAAGGNTYTWSTTATTASISITPTVTTTYTVTGSGFGTCPGSAVQTVTVTATPPPTVTISGSTVTCNGIADVLTAGGALSYTWSANAGSATTATVAPTPTVNTTYTVTGIDINGCKNTSTLSVTVNALPVITIAGTNTICLGNSTILTASGASTYTWDANAGSAMTNTVSVNPSVTTIYTVTGTNANGCDGVRTRTVTVNALPTLSVTPQTICGAATATLVASGANTYTWSPGLSGTNGSTVTGTPTVTTTYTVSGTNANGCVGTTTASIDVVSSLTVSAVASNSVTCAGSSVTLTGLGASSYSWTSGGGTISGGTGTTVTVTPAGPSTSYTVNGTSGTCTTTPYILSVNVNALPTVTAAAAPNDSICAGSTATLNGGGANTYSWTNGVTDATVFTPTVTATYTVTGTDVNGCTAKATQKITLNPLPTIAIATTVGGGGLCPGASGTLTASGAVTYSWTNTGATTAAIIVTPTVTTQYTVTGTDAFGCSNIKTRNVTVKPVPTVTVSAPAALCIGQTATLTATSTGTVTVGTYSWTTGATTASTTDSPTVTTTYTVFATGTGGGACTDTVRTTITVDTPPTLSVTAAVNPICAGSTETVTVSGATSYTWHPSNSHASTIIGVVNISRTFTVIGANGACIDSATYAIVVNPKPVITVMSTPANDTICIGNTATLMGMGANTYTWTSGITDATAFTPTVTATYTVTGTDANNCVNTNTVEVVVNTCSSGLSKYSNLNTQISVYPNPSNGNLFVSMNNFEKTSVEVYNSLGEKVYTKTVNANTESINLEKLNSGLYIIHVKQSGTYIYRSNIVLTK